MPAKKAPATGPVGRSDPEYLTTLEVARLLRLNHKKVYALLQQRRLPAARVSGKWLFPRVLLERWLAEHTVYPPGGIMGALLDRLLVVHGSDDWLLGNAIDTLRSRRGAAITTALVGSIAGLKALADGGAHVAGLHVPDKEVRHHVPEGETWYLVDLAEREQGLMFRPARKALVASAADVVRKRLRLADRQPESGTYRLTRRLIAEAGADPANQTVGPYSSHIEVGLAVRGGLADVGTGVRVAAEMCGLGFLPLCREKFRLAVPGHYFGHARVAEFLETLLAEFEAARKRSLPGYSFDSLGKILPLRG